VLFVSAWLLAGCGQPPPATFVLNEKATKLLIPEAQETLKQVLADNFGDPNQLVAWQKFPIDYGAAQPGPDNKDRDADGWRLKEGRNLYMQHCLHCHGVSGDGNGPTARFLNPRPRDYRQGVFKFKSTQAPFKPAHADLVRVLKEGIPGTYMPSFVLLGDEKLGMIVDYVRWLSIRGDMEIKLYNELAAAGATPKDVASTVENLLQEAKEDGGKRPGKSELNRKTIDDVMKGINDGLAETVETVASDIAESWAKAEEPESVIAPKVKRTPPSPASIDRGRKLYLSQVQGKKTQCADCHGPAGRGDGPNTEQFWPIPGTTPERKYETVGLHDEWGFPQQPRNLTRGVYRGGRRPVDIYRRIFAGIRGTQMPGFGGTVLNDEEIWDVVNYVLSIPFDGKASAYPTEVETEPKAEVADVRKQEAGDRGQ
jgi:mono/diheme cytochrome c family protein